ncbi:transposase [Sinorhizobium meliloti]
MTPYSRVRRTIAGIFHRISPQHADLYFHEIGFRW